MDSKLAGTRVLVTGASGGIGQTIARSFADEGSRVGIHYFRGEDSALALVESIGGNRALAVGADLRDESQVDRMYAELGRHWGGVDVLVANAGVWPPDYTPVQNMTLEQWNETLLTDLTAVFLSARGFLRQLPEDIPLPRSIILIGSTAGVVGEAGHADYATCKSGLIGGFLLSLKNEMARMQPPGRINAVCPGWTITPMTEKFAGDADSMKQALSTIAMRKFAAPRDIASAVVFLASPSLAGHISGQVLVVSGGMEGRQLYKPDEIDVDSAIPRS